MATLVNKPGTIEFLTFVTNEKDTVDIAFEEIHCEDLSTVCHEKTLGELNIGPSTGTHIIGFIRQDGRFIVNPTPEERVTKGSSMITLGTREQLDSLKKYLDSF